jgi:hypothetical protein
MKEILERERVSFDAHRAAIRGSALPPPRQSPRGTFLHGFVLPFSLIAATLRDRELRRPYLRVAAVRGLIVAVIAALAIAKGDIHKNDKPHREPTLVWHRSKGDDPAKKHDAVKVDVPGLHVDLDGKNDKAEISVLGQKVPVTTIDTDAPDASATPGTAPPSTEGAQPRATEPATLGLFGRVVHAIQEGWAWMLGLVAFLSIMEGIVVFFSRRWDDWISFHGARLACIKPEDETPKTPKIALDLPWLYRKMKRRLRGYRVFVAGIPALLPLRAVPVVGVWLFAAGLTAWGWYWFGVFAAAKSAHAWADESAARPPLPIRSLNERVSKGWWRAPLRLYGRLWAALTASINPAVTTFERSPAPFMGLALARVILALPGLYLLARPIVPVAAGRICAEADPADRFSSAAPSG